MASVFDDRLGFPLPASTAAEGRPALFPDDAHDWVERVRLAQELSIITERLAELDGVPARQSLRIPKARR